MSAKLLHPITLAALWELVLIALFLVFPFGPDGGSAVGAIPFGLHVPAISLVAVLLGSRTGVAPTIAVCSITFGAWVAAFYIIRSFWRTLKDNGSTESQPSGAASGSQSPGTETERTPSATGPCH